MDEDYDTAVYVGDVLCTITELGHLEITADCDLRSTQIGDVLDVVVSVSGAVGDGDDAAVASIAASGVIVLFRRSPTPSLSSALTHTTSQIVS